MGLHQSPFVLDSDRKPLRAKIVATIGAPSTYPKDAVDLEGKRFRPGLNFRKLTRRFCLSGVDVIRINLSHPNRQQIVHSFRQIKKAILSYERQSHRRVAVLADLPGPKIRFNFEEPLEIEQGDEFTVRFDKESPTTVYIGKTPLKEAMVRTQQKESRLPQPAVSIADEQVVDNILGGLTRKKRASSLFTTFLNSIRRKIASSTEKSFLKAFIGDGEVVMRVLTVDNQGLCCRVISVAADKKTERATRSITLKGKKGFTLKGIDFDIPAFGPEDRLKLKAVLEADIYDEGRSTTDPPQKQVSEHSVLAYIGVSFAQTASDILMAKFAATKIVKEAISKYPRWQRRVPSVIAKIETQKGDTNRDYILDVSDGIMVARGDLGLQVNVDKVPSIQKDLVSLSRLRGKPVIIATQMLLRMTESIEPTRAEATDVSNAILDGADAVMMSEETATGHYPFHAIATMDSIVREAERRRSFESSTLVTPDARRLLKQRDREVFLREDQAKIKVNERRLRELRDHLQDQLEARDNPPLQHKILKWRHRVYADKHGKAIKQDTTNKITEAACRMAETGAKALVAATTSGRTVTMIARFRPEALIVGAAHDELTMRKLCLVWGTCPIEMPPAKAEDTTEDVFQYCRSRILKDKLLRQYLEHGDPVVFTAGSPLETPGTTNLINLRSLDDDNS